VRLSGFLDVDKHRGFQECETFRIFRFFLELGYEFFFFFLKEERMAS
jgi:hypothetical protein